MSTAIPRLPRVTGSAIALLLAFPTLLTVTACSTTPPRPELSAPNPKAAYNRPYTIRGRTYYPMASSAGYRERGIASWYGWESGNRTSMGTRFDPDGISAAHRTLPLPTLVRVTNLQNGRSVEVMVNDRGPFIDGRLIDLSAGTAKRLGITGTAPVEVVALGGAPLPTAPAPVPGAPSVAPAVPALPSAASAGVYLQTGAFALASNAEGLRQRLLSAGIANASVLSNPSPGSTLYKVRIGPFADSREAETVRLRLADDLGINAMVVLP